MLWPITSLLSVVPFQFGRAWHMIGDAIGTGDVTTAILGVRVVSIGSTSTVRATYKD